MRCVCAGRRGRACGGPPCGLQHPRPCSAGGARSSGCKLRTYGALSGLPGRSAARPPGGTQATQCPCATRRHVGEDVRGDADPGPPFRPVAEVGRGAPAVDLRRDAGSCPPPLRAIDGVERGCTHDPQRRRMTHAAGKLRRDVHERARRRDSQRTVRRGSPASPAGSGRRRFGAPPPGEANMMESDAARSRRRLVGEGLRCPHSGARYCSCCLG